MEVNLLDKLLYRPVVNTVYMKPNRRLGRIIGINGNLIFCIEQDFSIISVKTSDQFIRNCSVGTYKIIKHVNDSREWTRPLSSGCNKLIISKEGNVFLANKVDGIYNNTIFECNTNEGKTRIVRIGSIEVVNQTKLFSTLLKYAKEGKYDYHFFYYWILEEWKRFPNFDL